MNLFVQNKYFIRDLLLLFVLSLISLFWFKEGCFIASGDVAQYLDISNLMRFFPWAWDERIAAGEPCMHTTFSVPIGYFWLILKGAGVNLIAIEKAWVFLTFFVSALSMCYFMKGFVPEDKSRAPLFSAVFYTYNLFLIVAPLIVQYNLAPLYMFGPLTLGLWSRGLSSETARKRYSFAALFALSSFLYTHTNINIPHVAAFMLIILIYTAYHLIFLSNNARRDIVFIAVSALLYFFVNFWWIAASVPNMIRMSDVMQSTRSGWHILGATHIDEAFRFLGFWAWSHKHNDLYYFPFNENYNSWPLVILSYGIIFVALLAVIIRRKQSLFPAILAIAGLFLAQGSNGLLGSVYEFCWKNVKGFWIFREPWSKFTHINVFAFSILFGISISALYEKIKMRADSLKTVIRPAVFLFPLIVILAVLINSYPAVTGELIWDQYNYNVRSMHVKVPGYWPRLGKWFLENDPHARVFILPKTGYAKGPYDWESGFTSASTAAISFLPNQLAYWTDFPTTRAQLMFNDLFSLFDLRHHEDTGRILRMLGVKYVLYQNDVSWRFTWPDAVPHEKMGAALKRNPALRFKESFGKLDLYEVSNPLPIIYCAAEVKQDAGKDNNFFKGDFSFYVKKIVRINPAKYIAEISASAPYWLVFNESYNDGWSARIEKNKINKRLCVNGYANGWFIERTGDHQVVIEYMPQGIYELGKMISWAAGLVCILLIVAALQKRIDNSSQRS